MFEVARNEIFEPSGDQRSRGAGKAGTKMRASLAIRVGGPPVIGITNSDASWVLLVNDGVETT